MLMKLAYVTVVVIGLTFVIGAGCSSAPGVATQEESKQSMDETMSFDPMAADSTGTPASASP